VLKRKSWSSASARPWTAPCTSRRGARVLEIQGAKELESKR